MTPIHRIIIALIASCMLTFPLAAQDSKTLAVETDTVLPVLRPVTSTYALEIGSAHLADTYLTPLHYRGMHLAFQYSRIQAMKFNPEHWVMQWRTGVTFDQTENPAKNADMSSASISFSWAMMHRWHLTPTLSVAFGGQPHFEAGVLYLSRNGNNPASGKVSFTLDATSYAAWNTKVWKVPLTLCYQPSMPLIGEFFSPNYGQLYYQIYLGDSQNLTHLAWPGNFFRLDNLLTADLHFGSTSLRIGYHNSIFSSKVNNLVTQDIMHALVIGITTEWISLRPSQTKINARTISAL